MNNKLYWEAIDQIADSAFNTNERNKKMKICKHQSQVFHSSLNIGYCFDCGEELTKDESMKAYHDNNHTPGEHTDCVWCESEYQEYQEIIKGEK